MAINILGEGILPIYLSRKIHKTLGNITDTKMTEPKKVSEKEYLKNLGNIEKKTEPNPIPIDGQTCKERGSVCK
jgi:hypothetical protein